MGSDLAIALAMLLGPWALGVLVGRRWASTRRGAAAAALVGVLLTAVGLTALFLTSPPSASAACGEDECVRILGRWLEITLVREWPLYTVASWLGGIAIGSSLRQRRTDLPEDAR